MKHMNILVTGAAGLLGANLLYLLRRQYNIIGIDRNVISIPGTVTLIAQLEDIQFLERMIKQYKVELLVHCAAMTNVDLCEQYPHQAEYINRDNVAQIADLCARHHVKLVFISSDAVYEGDISGLHTEDETPAPISVYGKTKLAAERIVLSHPNNLVFRTNMYGFNYRDKQSFSEWIVNQLLQAEPLNMFYDCWFSPLLVNTLVQLLDMAIQKNLSGLYNLCSTGSISKYEMGCLIQRIFSLKGTINSVSMDDFSFFAPRTHNMGMDNGKLRRALGIQIETIEQGIEKLFDLWQAGYGNTLKGMHEIR